MSFERDKSLMPGPTFPKQWPEEEGGHTWHQYYRSEVNVCLRCGQIKDEETIKCGEQQRINNSHTWPLSGPYAEDFAVCKSCGLLGLRGGRVLSTNPDIVYTTTECSRDWPEAWYDVIKMLRSLGL